MREYYIKVFETTNIIQEMFKMFEYFWYISVICLWTCKFMFQWLAIWSRNLPQLKFEALLFWMTWDKIVASNRLQQTAARPSRLDTIPLLFWVTFEFLFDQNSLDRMTMRAIWASQIVRRPSWVSSCSSWPCSPPGSSLRNSPDTFQMFASLQLKSIWDYFAKYGKRTASAFLNMWWSYPTWG